MTVVPELAIVWSEVIARATANSYGRRFDTSFIVEYLVTQMLRGEEVYVGAPDSGSDHMYMGDHLNSYFLVIKSAKETGQRAQRSRMCLQFPNPDGEMSSLNA